MRRSHPASASRRRTAPRSFAGATLLVLLSCGSLAAQSSHTSKVTVPDDDPIVQLLARAQEAFTEQRVERAAEAWFELMELHRHKVVRSYSSPRQRSDATEQVSDGDRFRGVRTHLMQLFATLPATDRQVMIERFERQARPDLQTALLARDPKRLREIASAMIFAPSGRAAAIARIDWLMSEGRAAEAALAALSLDRDLASLNASKDQRAAALVRAGLAAEAAGDRASLARTLKSVQSEGLGDTSIAIAGSPQALASFLQQILSAWPAPAPPAAASWDPSIFDRRTWAMPFRLETNRGRGSELYFNGRGVGRSTLVRIERDLRDLPVEPTIANGAVYWTNGTALEAVSLYTGEPRFSPVRGRVREFLGLRQNALVHQVVVEDDLAFAALQVDPILREQQMWQGFQPLESIPARRLVAVDVNTGSQRWSHLDGGGSTAADRAWFESLSVNAPPIVVGDTVYCSGTTLIGVFQQWVFALSRDTGELRWRTFVGAGQQELNMFGNPIKEAVTGPLTLSEGTLYHCTNLGTVGALDASTGSILWQTAYGQERIPTTDNTQNRERLPGWIATAPAVHGEHLFVAPSDSLHLLRIARADGRIEVVNEATRNTRNANRYFLGVHQGIALVAGAVVTAIDADSLRLAWRSVDGGNSSSPNEFVFGRPAVVGNSVVYAASRYGRRSSTGAIRVLDLKRGLLKSEYDTQGRLSLGHIVVREDAVVMAGRGTVAAFLDLARIERELRRRLSSNPKDAATALRLADVLVNGRQWRGAIDAASSALKSAEAAGPRSATLARQARQVLHNAWLSAARSEDASSLGSVETRFQGAIDSAFSPRTTMLARHAALEKALESERWTDAKTHAAAMAKIPARDLLPIRSFSSLLPWLEADLRVVGAMLSPLVRAGLAEREGKFRDAVLVWHGLQRDRPDEAIGATDAWSLAGEQIERLLAKHGRGLYSRLESEARRELKQAVRSGDIERLRSMLRRYPQSQAANEGGAALGDLLLAAGDSRSAAYELARYALEFGKADAQQIATLARAFAEADHEHSQLEMLKLLVARHPGAKVAVQGKRTKVEGLLRTQREAAAAAAQAPERIGTQLSQSWTYGPDEDDGTHAIMLALEGVAPEWAKHLAFVHLSRAIHAIDVRTGKAAFTSPARDLTTASGTFARWVDGMLVHLDGPVIIARDRDGERWRHELDEASQIWDIGAAHGRLYRLDMLIGETLTLEVRMIDLVSGRELARRGLREVRAGRLSFSHASFAITTLSIPYEVHIYDAMTAERTSTVRYDRDPRSPRRTPPYLLANGNLVLREGLNRRRGGTPRVKVIDPQTRETVFEHREWRGASYEEFDRDDGRLLCSFVDPEGIRTKAVVLDLIAGKVLASTELDGSGDFFRTVEQGELDGDRAWIQVRKIANRGSSSQLTTQRLLLDGTGGDWATAPIAAENVRLLRFATENALLLLKTRISLSEFSGQDDAAELYLVDQETGRTLAFVPLGLASEIRARTSVGVTGGVVLVGVRSQVRAFTSPR